MYFTDRTVYVIAFDLTKDDPNRGVDYWLQAIAERTGKSKRESHAPILIVGTHVDQFPDINVVMTKLQVCISSHKVQHNIFPICIPHLLT